jgi:hypothetical protein
MRTQFTSKNVCASRYVSETFLPKWRLRELPTATGFPITNLATEKLLGTGHNQNEYSPFFLL